MRASLVAAALLAAIAATAARGAELGTLFFSPQEREQMDRLRRGETVTADVSVEPAAHAVTGFVKRSDGHDTVWIDGRPVPVPGRPPPGLLDPRSVRDYSRSADAVKLKRER